MLITAVLISKNKSLEVSVETNRSVKTMSLPVKTSGQGCAVNGGELLFTAIATCFCNDIYREAITRNMTIDAVEVTVSGQFGAVGEPCTDILYQAKVTSPEDKDRVDELVAYVDRIAEIHNTLRRGVPVRMEVQQP